MNNFPFNDPSRSVNDPRAVNAGKGNIFFLHGSTKYGFHHNHNLDLLFAHWFKKHMFEPELWPF